MLLSAHSWHFPVPDNDVPLFPPSLILVTAPAALLHLLVAPSAPGCLTASGRQARLRQAAAGAP
ncbi:hypothetical protein ZF09_004027, partial [Salmonella enterica subsp. enterica serovar Hadar]|nr:hypothetical protein [Salmonella enterica subsp. enterica serovar Hadar]EEJ0280318.1 hypothetical protein [Salmonella enterica subsp. enterica serovar Hadar]